MGEVVDLAGRRERRIRRPDGSVAVSAYKRGSGSFHLMLADGSAVACNAVARSRVRPLLILTAVLAQRETMICGRCQAALRREVERT